MDAGQTVSRRTKRRYRVDTVRRLASRSIPPGAKHARAEDRADEPEPHRSNPPADPAAFHVEPERWPDCLPAKLPGGSIPPALDQHAGETRYHRRSGSPSSSLPWMPARPQSAARPSIPPASSSRAAAPAVTPARVKRPDRPDRETCRFGNAGAPAALVARAKHVERPAASAPARMNAMPLRPPPRYRPAPCRPAGTHPASGTAADDPVVPVP